MASEAARKGTHIGLGATGFVGERTKNQGPAWGGLRGGTSKGSARPGKTARSGKKKLNNGDEKRVMCDRPASPPRNNGAKIGTSKMVEGIALNGKSPVSKGV